MAALGILTDNGNINWLVVVKIMMSCGEFLQYEVGENSLRGVA